MDTVFVVIHSIAALVAIWYAISALNSSTDSTPWPLRCAFALMAIGAFALLLKPRPANIDGLGELVVLMGLALSCVADRRRHRALH